MSERTTTDRLLSAVVDHYCRGRVQHPSPGPQTLVVRKGFRCAIDQLNVLAMQAEGQQSKE